MHLMNDEDKENLKWLHVFKYVRDTAIAAPLAYRFKPVRWCAVFFLQQVRLVQQEQRQDRRGEGEALLHVAHRKGARVPRISHFLSSYCKSAALPKGPKHILITLKYFLCEPFFFLQYFPSKLRW
jgi:hypothetical protein